VSAKDANVGKDTEQRLARWLREQGGFPHAERTVRTGYRNRGRSLADAGDIDGTPGLAWQAKSLRPGGPAQRAVDGWLAETEAQRQATGADIGVLVVRRWGTTDVGRWWAFLRVDGLTHMAINPDAWEPVADVPVRLELRHAAALLRWWGYGQPLDDAGPRLLTSANRESEPA
jgi:hypothetical protein